MINESVVEPKLWYLYGILTESTVYLRCLEYSRSFELTCQNKLEGSNIIPPPCKSICLGPSSVEVVANESGIIYIPV